MYIKEDLINKLNEENRNFVLSPYSFEKAISCAKYVLAFEACNEKPDMSQTEGVEEFNNWYSEQEERHSFYEGRATEVFGDNRTKVSFSDAQGTADIINNDCNEKTHGMIPEIAHAEDFLGVKEPGLLGVVLNAIYLNQKWRYVRRKLDKFVFNGKETEGMESESDEPAGMFFYKNGYIVTMLLKNGFKLHAFTPNDITKGLSAKDYKFISNYAKQNHSFLTAKIKMPFIKTDGDVEYTYEDDLNNRLKLRQRAKLNCDDKGVEAAAATMALCFSGCTSEEKPVIDIVLDRPFFLFIEKDGKIFFVGKKVDV